MNYGFVIDNRRCIGCHACSTACKSENHVPLGVNRTWVKYTETGRYPDTRRHFQVSRCNHCDNPPCTRICPVTAMYQRDDGIVEFDGDQCIGCKACMQACPYDAIYIDPDSGTAAKCHFCAHRVESGMEPACVVVCPSHAIIAGDMDDPDSEISRTLARNATTVRKPEQGTAPKLHYIDGHAASLVPTATERAPSAMIWADVIPLHGQKPSAYTDLHHGRTVPGGSGRTHAVRLDFSGNGGIRVGQPQGAPERGPITTGGGGTRAAHMVQQQVAYNAQHKVPWHWPVPAYLVTKGIGAGLPLLLALGVLGAFEVDHALATIGGLVSLVFLGITTALLVFDLERPERFLRIVFRPQWRSWLTRGAFILIGFTNGLLAWTGLEAAAWLGMLDGVPGRSLIAALAIPLAIGATVYTAFLFAQAEGRDLWQSSILPVHLLVQAAMMGAGALVIIRPGHGVGMAVLGGALVVDLLVTLGGEFGIPHASDVAATAAHMITRGRYKRYWQGSLWLGHVGPLALLGLGAVVGEPALAIPAAVFAAIGLYLYEYAFVMAPQEVPNS